MSSEPVTHRSSLATGAKPRRFSRTLELLLLPLALLPLLLLQAHSELPAADRLNGAALWIACVAPIAWYVFRRPNRREAFPFFPLVALIYGAYYALPSLSGAVNLAYRPDQFRITYLDATHDFRAPTELALWGWMLLLLGYSIVSLVYRGPRVREQVWPARPLIGYLIRLLVVGTVAETLQLIASLPGVLNGTITFVTVLSRFAVATLVVMRVQDRLQPRDRAILVVAIPLQILLLLAEGSIAKVMLFVLLLVLAHWSGGGRLRARWIVGGLIAALALLTLKGVLQQYRRQAWFAGVQLNPVESAGLMALLVADQVKAEGVTGAITTGWGVAVSRSATLDLLADAVRRTPSDVPYWGGETYLSLVGVAIPRVLWPTKPTKRLGQDFGHRYAYIEPNDQATSVNLPYLVEFYINFGSIGVFLGMFVTGMIYRILDATLNRPGQNIVRTVASMSILIPLLNVESDFSLVFGGVFLNAVAFSVVLRYMRHRIVPSVTKARSPRPAQALPAPAPHEGA